MKILVPVDGSPASYEAAKKSAELAEKYGFSIKLITVVTLEKVSATMRNERLWAQVDGSILNGKREASGEDKIAGDLRGNAEELLDSIIEDMKLCGLNPEKEVLMGEPYERIVEAAKKDQVDLIVMGNRGFSPIKRFFVGSVTQKVISEAPCPVLVIRYSGEETT